MSEKNHPPSQRKLREARGKGQIARSRLFTNMTVTLGGLGGFLVSRESSVERLRAFAKAMMAAPAVEGADALDMALRTVGTTLSPILLGAMLASLSASLATSGFHFNLSGVAPSLERIDPVRGLRRLVSVRTIVELGKSLLIAAVVGALFWADAREQASAALRVVLAPGPGGLEAILDRVLEALFVCGLVLLALGVGDFFLARRRHMQELMMSRQEVQQEQKNSEGDPHHRAQRKARHRQLAGAGPARGVGKATAVVVNPTHIAVAIRYAEGEAEAPYIVAKGRDADALAIRREAARLSIPIVRNIAFARSLIHYDVGEEIPEELYQAAAVILRVAVEEQHSRAAGGMS